jgi:hypothetical protein
MVEEQILVKQMKEEYDVSLTEGDEYYIENSSDML